MEIEQLFDLRTQGEKYYNVVKIRQNCSLLILVLYFMYHEEV